MRSFIRQRSNPLSILPATPGLSNKNSCIHSCHKYLLSVCYESWGLGGEPGTMAGGRAGGGPPTALPAICPRGPRTESLLATGAHPLDPSRQAPKMGIMVSAKRH